MFQSDCVRKILNFPVIKYFFIKAFPIDNNIGLFALDGIISWVIIRNKTVFKKVLTTEQS